MYYQQTIENWNEISCIYIGDKKHKQMNKTNGVKDLYPENHEELLRELKEHLPREMHVFIDWKTQRCLA